MSTYVLYSADQALPPRIQREVCGPPAQQVVTLSNRDSLLSQPQQLAQVLIAAASFRYTERPG